MIDLTKALAVDGWMSEPELRWLAENSAISGITVEIGSWMGRTTRALADNSSGIIYAVDTWEGSADQKEFLKDKPRDFLYDKFRENLKDHILAGKVIPVRLPSLEAAADFAKSGMKFGMVFIDASHEYEDVYDDILAWRPLVADGGLLSGHDYDSFYHGVVLAVRELIAEVPQQAAGGSSIWYTHVGKEN